MKASLEVAALLACVRAPGGFTARLPVLEEVRSELGLPESCRLEAELHNLLGCAPGRFFARHQDSEKADRMVGTRRAWQADLEWLTGT